MAAIHFLLLVCVAVVAAQAPPFKEICEKNMYPPTEKNRVPFYTVNLDLPPKERWTEVVTAKKDQIKKLIVEFKKFAEDFGNGTVQKIIEFIDKEGDVFMKTLPAPFGDEMVGISNATGIPLGEVILYNVFYEIFTFCTSIVAEDSKGKLYHARNLDFGLFLGWDVRNKTWEITEALRPCIINVNFTKGGKSIYKSVHFAGYLGILTGVKANMFTLSMNERFNADGGYIGIIEWIIGMRSGHWMGFLTRNTMENAKSYEEAIFMLSNTTMLAPAYFILGGTKAGEGTVITRSREKTVDTWEMKSAGKWYILETNYDHWKKPLFVDDRRTPAERCMKNMTMANTGYAGLFDVLSSKPVLNKLTTYTALMQVDSGHLETWLRYCPDPCWPI